MHAEEFIAPSILLPLQSTSKPTVLALALVLLWTIRRIFSAYRGPLSGVPSPPGADWIWGHEKSVFDHNVGQTYTRWFKSLGHAFKIKAALGGREILVISDPAAIAHLMQKRIYDYHHSEVVRPRIERLLGRSLGWIEGESEHRRMRQLIGPSLSVDSVRNMNQDILEAANKVQEALQQVIQQADGKTTINILDWTGRATLEVIGHVGFGHDFAGGTSEDAKQIMQAWRKQASLGITYKGFLALMLLRRFPIINHLPVKAVQAQSIIKLTIRDGVAHEMIRRNEEVLEDTSVAHKDLLSRLMIAHQQQKISDEELIDHICTFIVAGHETTSQTLGLSVWELARHPEMQQRLRDEVNAFPGVPTYDDYQNQLPYLDAIFRETLRLHPAVPYMERVATKPDVLPLRNPIVTPGGKAVHEVPIAPGQTVIIPIISVNRMESVWGDGEVFRPDRWFEALPSQDLLCSGWGNTLAFSDGPRNCIGTRLALFQYKIILSTLIRRFSFKETASAIRFNVCSSVQPWVEGARDEGPQLPVEVELV